MAQIAATPKKGTPLSARPSRKHSQSCTESPRFVNKYLAALPFSTGTAPGFQSRLSAALPPSSAPPKASPLVPPQPHPLTIPLADTQAAHEGEGKLKAAQHYSPKSLQKKDEKKKKTHKFVNLRKLKKKKGILCRSPYLTTTPTLFSPKSQPSGIFVVLLRDADVSKQRAGPARPSQHFAAVIPPGQCGSRNSSASPLLFLLQKTAFFGS